MENSKEPFLAVDDVFRSGKSVARKKRTLRAHPSRPRIDRVLHVGQFAGRHRARTKCPRCADANGRNHLISREIKHATRCKWRCERAQRRMMPAVFAHTGSAALAKTHFNFV